MSAENRPKQNNGLKRPQDTTRPNQVRELPRMRQFDNRRTSPTTPRTGKNH